MHRRSQDAPVQGIERCDFGFERLRLPVLDLHGSGDLPAVLARAARRAETLRAIAGSSQVQVSGADHFFHDHERELVQWVRRFLDRTLAR